MEASDTRSDTISKIEDTAVEQFKLSLADEENSVAVAAIKTLLHLIKRTNAGTVAELRDEIGLAIKALTGMKQSVVSISSGCDLFVRFITLTSLDQTDFNECKKLLLKRGDLYIQNVSKSRQKIAKLGNPFITDGTTILTHSISKVVFQLLKAAADAKKRIMVFIAESGKDKSGWNLHKKLQQHEIPSKVILDSAVGFIMEKVDLVVVGAEGVVESGGIINKVGTYQLAVLAKTTNKPFYVVAESFKFVRLYPLNQQDLPNDEKYDDSTSGPDDHPTIDYTPPQYISLLFTDLGVLTPSAVSDELIKLYY
ncbi:translation initiation factor eIF2B subunit alpha-like [Dysidea avara]|uniref:translation initiation factor eIF2B subunit alpha-like n=1 Tax=Dysidea avara TaxID=196820 RepID=UPI00331CF915